MNSPAHDTALYLADAGVTGAFGVGVFVGREPLTPVDVVTCYDTGGAPGPLIDLRTPTVQGRGRADDDSAGWYLANLIHDTLTRPVDVAVPGGAILGWTPNAEVAFIGRDDNDRALFTVNFEIIRDSAVA
mgnify:CR=1 FL=1